MVFLQVLIRISTQLGGFQSFEESLIQQNC